MLAKRPSHSTLMLNDTPLSRASPLPHLELNAPRQCTVNRNRARQPILNPAFICKKNHNVETQKPRITGLPALLGGFLLQLVKNWHAPCNSPFSDSIHYPVSGTLVQAGRGFPSLHRAHTANATSSSRFGVLGTGRPGIPSLHQVHAATREPSRFGALGTGRPGIPSLHRAHAANARALPFWEPWYRQAGDSLFYCSRRWISSRQRSSTSLPAHSPCNGRAATTVSNSPPSLKRVRQFTSLPLSLS